MVLLTYRPSPSKKYKIIFMDGSESICIANSILEAINLEKECRPKQEVKSVTFIGYLKEKDNKVLAILEDRRHFTKLVEEQLNK